MTKPSFAINGFLVLGVFAIAGVVVLSYFTFLFAQRDPRITIENNTDRDLRVRDLLSNEYHQDQSPFITPSRVINAGVRIKNTSAGCLLIEDDRGNVTDSVSVGVGFRELFALPPNTQKIIRLGDPHKPCSVGKEAAKTCRLSGKEGYVAVSECP